MIDPAAMASTKPLWGAGDVTMSETVYAGGGFNGVVRASMSPGLQRRIAEQEAEQAKADARAQRWREQRAEEARAVQSAIIEAAARGEDLNMPRALRGEGLGHTHGEFISLVSAQQDREDFEQQARERAAFRRLANGAAGRRLVASAITLSGLEFRPAWMGWPGHRPRMHQAGRSHS
jgi:hypothetical protein